MLAYNQLSTKSCDSKVDAKFLTSVENTQLALKSEFQVFIAQAMARVKALASQSVPDSQIDAVQRKLDSYKEQVQRMRENMDLFKENIKLLKDQNSDLQSKLL